MASRNRVDLIGNVGADPELRTFQDGGRVANLSLATTEKWRDRATGEAREATEWHRVTVRGDGLVGVVEKYVRKGARLAVAGKLRTRKWQDQSGADRYTTEVVVAGYGGELILLGDPRGGGASGSGSAGGEGQAGGGGEIDDDIPF